MRRKPTKRPVGRDLRVKYFHHWDTDPGNAQTEALDALATVSSVASKYLEIISAPPNRINQANVSRVRRYMDAVADKK